MARWNRKPPAGTQIDWSHPLSQKLVTAWTFAEGSGVPADLVRRRSATVAEGLPTWQGGRSGPAIRFDASNAYTSVATTSTSVTIAALVRCTNPTAGVWQSVCARGTITGQLLFIGLSNGNYWVVSGASAPTDTISSVLADTNWHTLVGTTNGTHLRLYLDATEIASQSISVAVTTSGLALGRQGYLQSGFLPIDYWRGLIECIYSWDRALTADEVKAWHADPYGMLMAPVPRRSWFLPTSPPPPASSGNLLLLGVG